MPTAEAVSDRPSPNGLARRAGATWVAATGAALVLVAAAVFVASRWNQIPDECKLGMLMTGTAACAWLGRKLRTTLPATGSVVFHLGVLLVPANVAAVALHLDLGLGQHLLVQGLIAMPLFRVAAISVDSPVLRWASIAAAPVFAAGVASQTPIPSLAVLVALAALAELRPDLQSADAVEPLAIGAGLAPFAVAVAALQLPHDLARTLVHTLNLTSADLAHTAWATGMAAAVIIGRRAQARADRSLAAITIVSVLSGFGAAFISADLSLVNAMLGLAAAFLLIETIALGVAADSFWSYPVGQLARFWEAPALLGGVGVGTVVLLSAPFADEYTLSHRTPMAGAVFFTLTAGFWIADLARRRGHEGGTARALVRGGGSWVLNLAVAVCVPCVVLLATGSLVASGVTVAVLCVAFVAAQRPPVGLAFAAAYPALSLTTGAPTVRIGVGVVLSAVLLVQARGLGGRTTDTKLIVTIVAPVIAVVASLTSGMHGAAAPLVAAGTIVALSLLAEALDAETSDAVRLWLVVPVFAVLDGPATETLLVSAVVAIVLGADALRLRRPVLAGFAAAAANVSVGAAVLYAGFTVPQAGIALAIAAVVWAGIAATVDSPWQEPLLGGAALAAIGSVLFAAGDPEAMAVSLLILGALALTGGLLAKQPLVAHAGGLAIVVGTLLQLSVVHVTLVEAYLVPVALYLVISGELVRRRSPQFDSWVTAAPAPALLGGAAVLQRLNGGGAVHALIAALVGGLAVAVGGSRRQAGPMLTGTAVLVALAGHESIAVLAGVPAWGWIGLVGASLIGVAVAIERADTNPVEVGRRLVDVISEQFD